MNSSQTIFTLGIRYMLLATLCFATMQSLVKYLPSFHVFELVFFRSVVTSLFCFIYLKKVKVPLIGKNQKWLFLRAIVGIISMTLFFFTLQRMPIGASVSLKYLSPIFTAIFAVLLLKEKLKPIQWFYFLLAVFGVLLLKGFDTRIDTLNLIMGVTGAAFGGLVYVLIRKIGTSEHSLVIVNYFMFSASVLAGLAMIPFWKTPSMSQLGILLSIGTLGFFAQLFMTKAFQLEAAVRVAPFKYLEVFYSLIIGLIWFDESYNFISLIGIALIISCMFLNVLVKNK